MTLVVIELVIPLLVAFAAGLGVGWFWWRWRQPKVVVTETRTIEQIVLPDVAFVDPSPPLLLARVSELEAELASVDAQVGQLEQLITSVRPSSGSAPAPVAEAGDQSVAARNDA